MTITDVNDQQLDDLLLTYKSMGGVIDYSVMQIKEVPSEYEAHYQAALCTLKAIQRDMEIFNSKLAKENPYRNKEQYFHITFSQDFHDSGNRITAPEFFGPFFDIKNERIILLRSISEYGEPHYNNYCYHNVPEIPENIIDTRTLRTNDEFITQGYADAFADPPYGLSGTNMEVGELFVKINRHLFSDFDHMVIYKWFVDCSNYFDAGKEYWGSFFWTVCNPSKEWYIGILASTTD